ncbi:MAG: hypothetical protein J6S71_10600 [Clostridia bacterium]|nr:hypothetical protein [Clostridia bacterium]
MKNDKTFDDKRLLGVLDGVDQKFIAEALESYDLAEPQKTRKAPIYRRVALLAACLLLVSAAFPIINYVLPRFGITVGGNAGAGSEEVQTAMTSQSQIIDSPYDRSIDAYPEGMPVNEILEDVLKGGWVVCDDNREIVGYDLWNEFLDKVDRKESCSVLVAWYGILSPISSSIDYEASTYREFILLNKISYNGEKYDLETRNIQTIDSIDSKTSGSYLYLYKTEFNPSEGRESNIKLWVLADEPNVSLTDYFKYSLSSTSVSLKYSLRFLFPAEE